MVSDYPSTLPNQCLNPGRKIISALAVIFDLELGTLNFMI